MANTVQIKRGNNTSVNAHTGPSGELIYNLDTGRLHAQDGSTAGGNPHALVSDVELKANADVNIIAGDGLTGGGTLAANRTLALSSASIASLSLADSAVQSVNGKSGSAVVLGKGDIGLGNVDNTSDASKPISTATQTALNAKANSSVTVSAGTGLTGGGNLTANRTVALNAASIASLAKADTALQAPGGATGQVLAKNSADDNDVAWVTSEAATAVSYAPQTLTPAQQEQTKKNIAADIVFDSKVALEAAEVSVNTHAVRLNGYDALGDGKGGLYIDTDNGSTDTIVSGDSRTWYKVKDIEVGRIGIHREKWGLFADWQPVPDDLLPNDENPQVIMMRNLMDFISSSNPDIKYGVFDGDLVDRSSDNSTGNKPKYAYDEFFQDWRDHMLLPWDNVFALPGNHERDGSGINQFERSWSYLTYRDRVGRLYYHIKKGNIVQIFMGDMGGSNSGEILPEALTYLSDVLRMSQDCNVIIHMHQPMRGAYDSPDDGTFQSQSVELAALLNTYDNIAAVFYGHVGATWELTTMHRVLHGTTHINIQAGIPTAHGNGRDVPFSTMTLHKGATSITVERWNATQGARDPSRDVTVQTKFPINLGNIDTFEFDGRQNKWWFDKVDVAPRQTYMSAADFRAYNGVDWRVKSEVAWLQSVAMGADANDNIPIGTGVGYAAYLPGSEVIVGNDGYNDVTRPLYGMAGGISWSRRFEQDTNYGSYFEIWARRSLAAEPEKVLFGFPEEGVNSPLGITAGMQVGGSVGNANENVARMRSDGLLINSSAASAFFYKRGAIGNVAQFYKAHGGSSTIVGSISVTESGTSYNQTSDANFKESKGDLSFDDACQIIELITIHNFTWTGEYAKGGDDVGAFAQELYEIYPRAVTAGGWFFDDGNPANEGDEGAIYQPWAVDYSKLMPVVIRVIQGLLKGNSNG